MKNQTGAVDAACNLPGRLLLRDRRSKGPAAQSVLIDKQSKVRARFVIECIVGHQGIDFVLGSCCRCTCQESTASRLGRRISTSEFVFVEIAMFHQQSG